MKKITDSDSFSKAELHEAKLLAAKGEEAIKSAEESGEESLMVRAELARTFFMDEAIPDSTNVLDRRLLEQTPFGIFTVDAMGRYLDINNRAVELSGYSKEEIRSMSILDIIDPEERENGIALFRRLITDREIDGEIVIRSKSGERRRWNIKAVAVGRHFTGFCSDIPMQSQSESQLRRVNNDLERVLNTVTLSIVQLNRESVIEILTQSGGILLECPPDSAIGKNWFENFVPPEEKDNMEKVFGNLMEGRLHEFEYVENYVLTKPGKKKLVAWHNEIVRDAKGGIIGTLSSGEDITERRAMEMQLQHSRKMEAVGQLAGGVAHDFNNALTVILGYCDLAKADESQASIRVSLDGIAEAGKKAAQLTAQLLAFSRKQVLQPEIITIYETLQGLEKMARRVIPEDIKLVFTVAHNLGSVHIDPVQFENVMLNLFLNARDAMPDGGMLSVDVSSIKLGSRDIRLGEELKPGPHLKVSVTDTGTGIAPDKLEKIFEPFYSTKGERGTGLGLASALGIVQQSGGSIRVTSKLGEGSTFVMLFPSFDSRLGSSLAKNDPSWQFVRVNGNVVVVEDDPIIQRVTARLLGRAGLKVETFGSPNAVIEFMKGKLPEQLSFTHEEADLIMSDVKMPEMNGTQLVRIIRKIRPDIEILLVSGYASDVHGVDHHEIPFLQKPYSARDLTEKIGDLLKKRKKTPTSL